MKLAPTVSAYLLICLWNDTYERLSELLHMDTSLIGIIGLVKFLIFWGKHRSWFAKKLKILECFCFKNLSVLQKFLDDITRPGYRRLIILLLFIHINRMRYIAEITKFISSLTLFSQLSGLVWYFFVSNFITLDLTFK